MGSDVSDLDPRKFKVDSSGTVELTAYGLRCAIEKFLRESKPAQETPKYGRYKFTPDHLTEADIRRIVREELDRAKGKP